jgi:hypothetical protein
MGKRIMVFLAALILTACTDPNSVRFGPTPSEDLETYSSRLKKLPPDDLALLTSYVSHAEMKALEGISNPAIGKTVAEVMGDARSWQKAQQRAAAEERQRQEAARLEAGKIESERKLLQERVSQSVVVFFLKRTILPPNPEANRTESVIRLEYEVENIGGKTILGVKGKVLFRDLFGKRIVEHPFQTDKTIPIAGRLQVPVNYRISPIWREMMTLAGTEDGKFNFTFTPEALMLEGGETLVLSEKAVKADEAPPAPPGSANPGDTSNQLAPLTVPANPTPGS